MVLRALLLVCLCLAQAVCSQPRFIRKANQSLQTSVCHYQRGNLRVDLVGALHVGQPAYYADLNRRLGKYPAVLYELIAHPPGDPHRQELYDLVGMRAPRSNPIPRRGDTDNSTTAFQRELCDKLGLVFQLDHIDYQGDNFYHADITPVQLEQLLKGDQPTLKERLQSLANLHQSGNPLELMALWWAPTTLKNQSKLRIALAPSLLDLKGSYKAMQGKEALAYIDARNQRALKVLQQELARGQRHVAIFYGAAHIPDMHRRLVRDLHFRYRSEEWLSAWPLKPVKK